ncbi:hypothetical protein [Litorihabitans aurantiacus]|uniref:hypothetical protein n=1 Tax=Litorihabitans aurantiacus TaxID=1930061 RepID=UPI0024E103B6|nr:hypothetical protein [Litorihabitans aurantiacus]
MSQLEIGRPGQALTMLLDSWHGLASPTRGLPMAPLDLPTVVPTRNLPRRDAARLLENGDLVALRPGVLAAPPDAGASSAQRRSQLVLQHVRAHSHMARTDLPFSHQTAALLLGCWILGAGLPVHVTAPPPSTGHRPSPHLRVHHTPLEARDIRLHQDVRVTCIERTVADCARTLPLVESVVLVDSALRMGADREDVLRRIATVTGARGVRAARRTMEIATAQVHSPGESFVRAVAVADGLPLPRTLHLVDTEIGRVELDIAWPEMRVAVEFDGAVKLARLRGEELTREVNRTSRREAALARAGWVVLHLTWSDLRDRDALVVRLRRLVRHRATG